MIQAAAQGFLRSSLLVRDLRERQTTQRTISLTLDKRVSEFIRVNARAPSRATSSRLFSRQRMWPGAGPVGLCRSALDKRLPRRWATADIGREAGSRAIGPARTGSMCAHEGGSWCRMHR